jgi:NAD+ diphosphatase
MTTSRPGLTGSPLDRADHLRGNDAAIAELQSSLSARLLMLDGLDPQLDEYGGLRWGSLAEAPVDAELAFLGFIEERPRFAALTRVPHGGRRSPAIFHLLETLPPGEAGTYAAARSLVDWHSRHLFCAHCGNETRTMRAGWARICDASAGGCGHEHFPRTDPVVIMLAEHRGRVLVGRQPGFPPGFYSALAGFVELGDSIEEAVARELKEEAGVEAVSVRYVASQPWPFPSSLMIACTAEVASDAIRIDTTELEHAMWVTRDEVAAALAGDLAAPFLAPPPYAIAYTLFERWLGS